MLKSGKYYRCLDTSLPNTTSKYIKLHEEIRSKNDFINQVYYGDTNLTAPYIIHIDYDSPRSRYYNYGNINSVELPSLSSDNVYYIFDGNKLYDDYNICFKIEESDEQCFEEVEFEVDPRIIKLNEKKKEFNIDIKPCKYDTSNDKLIYLIVISIQYVKKDGRNHYINTTRYCTSQYDAVVSILKKTIRSSISERLKGLIKK